MKPIRNLFVLLSILAATTSFKHFGAVGKDDFYVIVDKSDYELKVYDAANNWLVTYPVVFGSKDMGDKMVEGDRKTPEGIFHIVAKRPHAKWDRFMAIDYPNAESYQKFNERKAQGIIPANAKIGGSIGIHGTWPHEEFAVDLYQNWTMGCVSTKNEYIDKLFKVLPVGTSVTIQR
jgi:murein L,D-transpeptidase YafK